MYRRFLNNKDYLGSVSVSSIAQLIGTGTNQDLTKYDKAERVAESAVTEYLTESYDIEGELLKGKNILNYSRMITYPVGSHFYMNGDICRAIVNINGYKAPTSTVYWELNINLEKDSPGVVPYSQIETYKEGDNVYFGGGVYTCMYHNGYSFNDIRVPGVNAWDVIQTYDWQPTPYTLWEVVKFDSHYYTLTTLTGYDNIVDPKTSTCWGLIGNYDNTLDTYELSNHEYVVYNDKVYYPITNPNADTPVLNTNIDNDDPRNESLVTHMIQLAVFELYKQISPNNVSQFRIVDYDHAMVWLKDCAKLKINPKLDRKIDRNTNEPVSNWQLGTFERQFNPYENPWQI